MQATQTSTGRKPSSLYLAFMQPTNSTATPKSSPMFSVQNNVTENITTSSAPQFALLASRDRATDGLDAHRIKAQQQNCLLVFHPFTGEPHLIPPPPIIGQFANSNPTNNPSSSSTAASSSNVPLNNKQPQLAQPTLYSSVIESTKAALSSTGQQTSAQSQLSESDIDFDSFYKGLFLRGGVHNVDKESLFLASKALLEACQNQKPSTALSYDIFLEKIMLTLDKMLYWHYKGYLQDTSLISLIFELAERFCNEKSYLRLSLNSCINYISILGYCAEHRSEKLMAVVQRTLADFADYLESQKNPLERSPCVVPNLIIALHRLHDAGLDVSRFFRLYTPKIKRISLFQNTGGFGEVLYRLNSFRYKYPRSQSQEAKVFFNAVAGLLHRWGKS